jgi:hypothetical protein
MKKIILFCLILSIEVFSQTISSVELNKTYCDWNGSIVFTDSVETVLRDINGNVIPPQAIIMIMNIMLLLMDI